MILDLPWLDRSRVDSFSWVTTGDPAQLTADGVTYLALETVGGQLIAWAPVGSPLPFRDGGEGTDWQIRVVTP